MLGKYMRVRRVIIPFLTMIILVSQLTGCVPLTSSEAAMQASATPEIILEIPDINESQDIILEEQGQVTQELTHKVEVEKYSQNELEALFEQSYQNIHTDPVKLKMALVSPAIIAVEGVDEQYIIIELDELRNISNPDKLPQDYPTQYRSWREAYIAAMLAKAEYISSLFEEVEEEVYTLNETTPYTVFNEDTISIEEPAEEA